jgi:hypothetical protein
LLHRPAQAATTKQGCLNPKILHPTSIRYKKQTTSKSATQQQNAEEEDAEIDESFSTA